MKRFFLFFMFFFLFVQQAEGKINTSYMQVSLKKLPPQIQFFAQVIPQKIYKISSAIDGRISSFNIAPGENIHKNSFIATIISTNIISKIRIIKEDIWQTKKNLFTAQSILNILQSEYHKQLISKQQMLKEKMEVEKIRTHLKILQIQLHSINLQTKLFAPINGKIINIYSANDDYVKSGQTILTILPNKNFLFVKAYGNIGTTIKKGQQGWFYSQLNTSPILVTVNSAIANPNTPGTWSIYLKAVHKNPNWFIGETGKLEFIQKYSDAIAVPKKALIMDAGKWWIVKKIDNKLKKIQIIPIISNNKWVWVKGGNINVGDTVLVSGAYQMFHENFSKIYEDPN